MKSRKNFLQDSGTNIIYVVPFLLHISKEVKMLRIRQFQMMAILFYLIFP